MTTLDDKIIVIVKSFGESLKRLRLKRGMTPRQVCNAASEDMPNYRSYEMGKRPISLRKMVKLADSLDADVCVTLVDRKLNFGGWKNAGFISEKE